VQRQLPRLGELGLPYGEHIRLQIDIGVPQRKRFGYAQARGSDQSEQCLESRRAQTASWGESPRGRQQLDDLVLPVDVRRHASRHHSEERLVGYLGARFELAQPACKWAQQLQPSCPRLWSASPPLVAACPVGHALDRQWPVRLLTIYEAREAEQCIPGRARLEAQAAPLG
jgi:hypothetical protein